MFFCYHCSVLGRASWILILGLGECVFYAIGGWSSKCLRCSTSFVSCHKQVIWGNVCLAKLLLIVGETNLMSVQDNDGSVLVRQSWSRSRNVLDHSMVSVSITSVWQAHLLADGNMAYMYTLLFFTMYKYSNVLIRKIIIPVQFTVSLCILQTLAIFENNNGILQDSYVAHPLCLIESSKCFGLQRILVIQWQAYPIHLSCSNIPNNIVLWGGGKHRIEIENKPSRINTRTLAFKHHMPLSAKKIIISSCEWLHHCFGHCIGRCVGQCGTTSTASAKTAQCKCKEICLLSLQMTLKTLVYIFWYTMYGHLIIIRPDKKMVGRAIFWEVCGLINWCICLGLTLLIQCTLYTTSWPTFSLVPFWTWLPFPPDILGRNDRHNAYTKLLL